jgi:hypothetical protein
MIRFLSMACVTLLFLGSLSKARAFTVFNYDRPGLTIATGLGAGYSLYSQDSGGVNLNKDGTWMGKPTVTFLYRLGWGFSSGYEIFGSFQNSFFPMKRWDGERKPYSAGIFYLGALKYLGSPQADTAWQRKPYLSIGAGLGRFGMLLDSENEDSRWGPGVVAGAGYELSSFALLDLSLYWGNPGRDAGETEISTQSLGLRLNLCFRRF